MPKINEILTLDLQEDIKNVIDLEDRSENEIQQEIESYIITEGIGKHLGKFTDQYTSNIKETGVWLSGFYGSGKSYFGKMLGYIIDNPIINGTPARDRFIPRLKGIANESLVENSIRKLNSIKSRVVFLDVAKQNTDRGLAFTLFTNLLKNLGFRDDLYGYMEFDLYIDGKYDEFKNKAQELEGKPWDELKKSNRQVAKVMRNVFSEMGYSEADYNDTHDVFSSAISNFSASMFKEVLERYLNFKSDETLVFIFDEASEAISQKKFTLLDLEGISEAISSISKKVWTIAIAQEKLNDVINNANVTRSQLTKLTARFKTKIHIESTEVDVIIRSRLLQKKESHLGQLIEYYNKNEGMIADATNLKSAFPTKTTSAEEFATYYPFHKYQFDILQKFLFSSNALVATQIAARGMIITTFDVLRKQMANQDLFAFTPGHAICTEAQTAPPTELVNKYDTATKILNEDNLGVDFDIDGEKLLKTIHILVGSEVVSPTIENITKSYINQINDYYDIKPKIEEALSLLVEAKVLLLSNNNYKITSDLEGKLLEEMKDFDVELFSKKRSLINYIKEYKFLNAIASFNDGVNSFKFSVISDQDDELCGLGNKQLKVIVYSLFNISENRQDFIESNKMDTQYNKDEITLIPDNKDFSYIDKLIGEISRYSYMEEKYSNESDPIKRQVIRDFAIIREEKEKVLRIKIELAYKEASLIYMFDEHLLNTDSFKATINEIQRKLIKNIYFKKLRTQLSETLVSKIFNSKKEELYRLFSDNEFKFFDANGNFTGDHLKIVEELSAKIGSKSKSGFVDGKSLEADFSRAPWGYSFGTIVSTLAVLFRAGRLSVKYNGDTWFSHEQKAVHDAFSNATKFKSASFKSITNALTAAQKNKTVQLLMDLEIYQHTGRKVDWNTNDFDLADTIRFVADHFISTLTSLDDTVNDFDTLFQNIAQQKQTLLNYSSKVTENNYIDKVEYLLTNEESFKSSTQTILKAQKFIKNNFQKVKDYKEFVEDVSAELKKANLSDDKIEETKDEFLSLYKQDMVKNFSSLRQLAQEVKDQYYLLIKNATSEMTDEYQLLYDQIKKISNNLKKNFPTELNIENQENIDNLKQYFADRIIGNVQLGFSTSCENSGFSLSEILNYTALAPNKGVELTIIETAFISKAPQPESESNAGTKPEFDTGSSDSAVPKPVSTPPRKIKLQVSGKIMTVQEYKNILKSQLTALAMARPDEKIELDIETLD